MTNAQDTTDPLEEWDQTFERTSPVVPSKDFADHVMAAIESSAIEMSPLRFPAGIAVLTGTMVTVGVVASCALMLAHPQSTKPDVSLPPIVLGILPCVLAWLLVKAARSGTSSDSSALL